MSEPNAESLHVVLQLNRPALERRVQVTVQQRLESATEPAQPVGASKIELVTSTAVVLAILRDKHGVSTDPASGPLKASDYRFIAEKIEADWNNYDIARELVIIIKARKGVESE